MRDAEGERLRLQSERSRAGKSATGCRRSKSSKQKVRELEKKLDALLRDFEYHAREAVNAVQDRAAAQKLSKEAERRIAKLRRDFREQFDSTVVAHLTAPIVAIPMQSHNS